MKYFVARRMATNEDEILKFQLLDKLKRCEKLPENDTESWKQISKQFANTEISEFVVLFRSQILAENIWIQLFILLQTKGEEELYKTLMELANKKNDINIMDWAFGIYDQYVSSHQGGEKIIIDQRRQFFKSKYLDNPCEFATNMLMFMKKEMDLLDKNENPQHQSMDTEDIIDMNDVIAAYSKLKRELESLNINKRQLDQFVEAHVNEKSKFERAMKSRKNGTLNSEKVQVLKIRFEDELNKINIDKEDLLQTAETCLQEIMKVYSTCESKANVLKEKVLKYKESFMQYHLNMQAEPPFLDKELVKLCGQLGEILHDLIRFEDFSLLEDILCKEEIVDQKNLLQDLLVNFFESTFVIVKQPRHVRVGLGTKKSQEEDEEVSVKKEEVEYSSKKFTCNKFEAAVRVLAAKKNTLSEFCMFFYPENQVPPIPSPSDRMDFPLSCHKCKFTDMGTGGTLKTELKSFQRKDQKNAECSVCEESYRLVFSTTIPCLKRQIKCVSLPLFVFTGTNQVCNGMGALTWRCCSSNDAYCPQSSRDDLPLKEVLSIINKKILSLNGQKQLNQHGQHVMIRRILQAGGVKSPENIDMSTGIPMKWLVVNKLMDIPCNGKSKAVTLWMWIQGCCNLIVNHLQSLWDKHLIEGFITRSSCRKLLQDSEPGTFILRFSESSLYDVQGQKLSGAISASYKLPNGQVDDLEPFEPDSFKKQCLVQKLKAFGNCDEISGGSLQYVYPNTPLSSLENYDDKSEMVPSVGHPYTRLKSYTMPDIGSLRLTDSPIYGNASPGAGRPIKKAKRRFPSTSSTLSYSEQSPKMQRTPEPYSESESMASPVSLASSEMANINFQQQLLDPTFNFGNSSPNVLGSPGTIPNIPEHGLYGANQLFVQDYAEDITISDAPKTPDVKELLKNKLFKKQVSQDFFVDSPESSGVPTDALQNTDEEIVIPELGVINMNELIQFLGDNGEQILEVSETLEPLQKIG